MVTDPTVTKVVMICDQAYVEKANSRAGGVGAESQIISPELYKSSAQDKFAAVMTEEDDEGNAHVPVFYKGRIYFDFRSIDQFEEGYEQLLRWLVDRPQHVKPKLGSVPESILETSPVATATQSRAKRAEEAIRQNMAGAAGLVRDYGDALRVELKALAPVQNESEPFDDTILASVTSMRPYLRQFAELVALVVRFSEDTRVWDRILGIHEQLGTLMYRDPELRSHRTDQFDAYKIIAHDAFLATIALALDEERFDLAEAALTRPYLVRDHDGGNRPSTSDFSVFRQHVQSLDHRNQRLKLNRISLQADILKEAHPAGSVPAFESLMQADFVLYLRTTGQRTSGNWYPYSLAYATNRYSPFALFARAESAAYLDRLTRLFGVVSGGEIKTRIAEASGGERSSNMFDYQGLPVSYLANAEHLGILG